MLPLPCPQRPFRSCQIFVFALLTLTLLLNAPHLDAQVVQSTYFGMDMHAGIVTREPWPTVPFGSVRLWDAGVDWSMINPSKGVYNWSNLDKWLADAQAQHVQLLYTFGRVPAWASSEPYNNTCGGSVGGCAPPNDVNPDGSGTDQHFKDFVTALATHNRNSLTGHITYWELWNEPYNPPFWVGTFAQLVRMSADATAILKSVDPSAQVLVPSVDIEGSKSRSWLDGYLAAGGSKYADGIAFHGYVQKRGTPLVAENILGYISLTQQLLSKYGLQNKPLWDTEASWGKPETSSPAFNDEDMRVGFVARMYLLQAGSVSRFFWYQWNNPDRGTMWLQDTQNAAGPGRLLKTGVAFGQVENWMVGATIASSCSANGTVWTCNFSRAGGYQAQAIWDAAQSCANGICTTSKHTVSNQWIRYRSLDGSTTNITGSSVPIGYKPILLEN